jgi:hypothetical protein
MNEIVHESENGKIVLTGNGYLILVGEQEPYLQYLIKEYDDALYFLTTKAWLNAPAPPREQPAMGEHGMPNAASAWVEQRMAELKQPKEAQQIEQKKRGFLSRMFIRKEPAKEETFYPK